MRKKAKKTKLEDLSRYVGVCIYCKKEISAELLKMVKAEQGKTPEPKPDQPTNNEESIPF